MTNAEILDYYLNNPKGNLPRKCVDCQFGRLARTEGWKMQYKEDLFQDLIVFLLTYDNDKLNNVHEGKHMNALITRIIQNQIYSDHSKFFNDYLKFNLRSSDLNDVSDEAE